MLPDFRGLLWQSDNSADFRSLEHRSDNHFSGLRNFHKFAKACDRGATHGYRVTLIGKLPTPFPLNCSRTATPPSHGSGTLTTVHPNPSTSAVISEWLTSCVSLNLIHANVRYTEGDDAVDLLTHQGYGPDYCKIRP